MMQEIILPRDAAQDRGKRIAGIAYAQIGFAAVSW
jgi:hypothetical protein